MYTFHGYGIATSNLDIQETVRIAKAADEKGFDLLTLPEVPNDRSGIIRSAAIACETNQIRIGIGILTPYLRHLTSIAVDSMGIDELSNGRFMLGLGAPIWKMAAYGFTIKNLRPLKTMREATIILRDLMAGQQTSIESPFFGMPKNLKLTVSPVRPKIPIYFGVVNKLMLQLAGEIADSIELGAVSHPEYTRWAVKHIKTGAERVGRDPRSIPIHGHVLTCIDPDPSKAMALAKPLVTYYLTFLEKIMLNGTGITDEHRESIRTAYQAGGKEAAIKLVTDEVIHTVGAVGSAEDVIKGVKRYLGTGLTHPSFWGPLGTDGAEAVRQLGQNVVPHLPTDRKPLFEDW
jgi:5,10-methylenetetrahydromethanopterin reductase